MAEGSNRPSSGRIDGRAPTQMRPVRITPNFIQAAEGSVLIEIGRTRVICTASVEEVVPPFLRNTGKGWVTSEYAMIPRATSTRTARESSTGKRSGRTLEIQRLIGRSLRTAINMDSIGERTIWLDCDVIEADGGTRTASITGSFIALRLAVQSLLDSGKLAKDPMQCFVAAVSVGIVGGVPMLDLNYAEDSGADVDFNIVMTDKGEFVEIQGTAERNPFTETALGELLKLGRAGIFDLIEKQRLVLSR
ncbi:MAG TPA: ribonuclease PH [Terriglobia bacterium]|nr:ribonuclease PH [Terriglobia bacterium]